MATIMTKRGQQDNMVTYEHICDTYEDINNIESEYITLGSVCIVLSGQSQELEVYIANSKKEWISLTSISGSNSNNNDNILEIHVCTNEEIDENTSLPNIANPIANVIYFVFNDGDANNLYTEYIYLDGNWELVGSGSIDVSDKADKNNTVLTGSLSLGRAANSTIGNNSIAIGENVTASGTRSSAFGQGTTASGSQAHTEGSSTQAIGSDTHAEGTNTKALGSHSHAEGLGTIADMTSMHAGGEFNAITAPQIQPSTEYAKNDLVVYQGKLYKCKTAHTSNNDTGFISSNWDEYNIYPFFVIGNGSDDEHRKNIFTIYCNGSVTEGSYTTISTGDAHAEGYQTTVTGYGAHSEGSGTTAGGVYSHVEGQATSTTSSATAAHAEGQGTQAKNVGAHAEGTSTIAEGVYSHAEGNGGTFTLNNITYTSKASGTADHTEGYMTLTASAQPGNHAEGYVTRATGGASHAEGSQTLASGQWSHAEGSETTASASAAHAEGYRTLANGFASHAEGNSTITNINNSHVIGMFNDPIFTIWTKNTSYSVGDKVLNGSNYYICKTAHTSSTSFSSANWTQIYRYPLFIIGCGSSTSSRCNDFVVDNSGSVMEGLYTKAEGTQAHAEGYSTEANGNSSHTEGQYTKANNTSAHAEGSYTLAEALQSHAEGYGGNYTRGGTIYSSGAYGAYSHVEGYKTYVSTAGSASHAEGNQTRAMGSYTHTEGSDTQADGTSAHAEGQATIAQGMYSHAEGYGGDFTNNGTSYTSKALGNGSHTEGFQTYAQDYAHSEGQYTVAKGQSSHAEGYRTFTNASYAHAEGTNTNAGGQAAHAEGSGGNATIRGITYTTGAYGIASHTEGEYTHVIMGANSSHAEGSYTIVKASYGHAEGYNTLVNGMGGHAEGTNSIAEGQYSHAEGNNSYSKGRYSHAEGKDTQAIGYCSHVQGYGTVATGNTQTTLGRYNIPLNDDVASAAISSNTYANSDIPAWDATKSYYSGDAVKVSDSYYLCIADAPVIQHPVIATRTWTETTYDDNAAEWSANDDYPAESVVKLNYYNKCYTNSSSVIAGESPSYENTNYWQAVNSSTTYSKETTTLPTYLEIVGNGIEQPSNARVLDIQGNEYLNGNLYVNCDEYGSNGKKVATEEFVTTRIPTPPTTDGTYTLQVTISSGEATYSWVSQGA